MREALQFLVSLPPAVSARFAALEGRHPPEWRAVSDPPNLRLGSGGGLAHLLVQAWQADRPRGGWPAWLNQSRKVALLGGGLSRRLPAYATTGKLLMPMPALRCEAGQRLDQSLLDLQMPVYRQVLRDAPSCYRAMVASGDVILRIPHAIGPLPEADILALGLWTRPDTARHFGVFFCRRDRPDELAFFLQKPDPARVAALAADYLYLVDTGIWLFSARALDVILRKCGWRPQSGAFSRGRPLRVELYSGLGLSMGASPPEPADPDIRALRCSVLPLPDAEFYHFGTSRDLMVSTSALQHRIVDQTRLGLPSTGPQVDQFILNSIVSPAVRQRGLQACWIENAWISSGWKLRQGHILTNVPENEWSLELEDGLCLDFVPVGRSAWAVRPYAMGDVFRGPLHAPGTIWMGRSFREWLCARGLTWAKAGLSPRTDLQFARLFPILQREQIDPGFLQWMFSRVPAAQEKWAATWCRATRCSAEELGHCVNVDRLYQQRERFRTQVLPALARNVGHNVFYDLDLQATAALYARSGKPLPPRLTSEERRPLALRMRDRMFRSAVLRHRRSPQWRIHEEKAFAILRKAVVEEASVPPALPVCRIQEDQIVWGRSPVRLDLAGGWTDTPPYCFEHGGRVVNLAANLNGQPPIQAFARLSPQPVLTIRSIDQGVEQTFRTYSSLDTFAQVGNAFSIAKAAFALAGFLPRFYGGRPYRTLADQLRAFGGGIELSLLAAVPKGSGLGTSSILAATLLGTLSDLCGLAWDRFDLFSRTLALEQLLTTGGGWQDQIGGLLPSVKLLETSPGLSQKPSVRWLPEELFSGVYANRSLLLYYTGLTRTAKSILREIVRGMFLNSGPHMALLREIGEHAEHTHAVIQRNDWPGLCAAINRSWQLNQLLDSGTNPPAVQAILSSIGDWVAGAKLLGAGGGGYMLICAKDETAAQRIRRTLQAAPANRRARFVDLSLSSTGLEVTRS